MNSRNISKLGSLLLMGACMGGALTSCQTDEFGEGEGILQLKMQVSATLTRSTPDNVQELRDGATIYLSSAKGLIYKWTGVDNVPASLPLKSGRYVAEAWAGDSVSASFDKKFYRGYQPFEITRGTTEQVMVNCHIANVVTAVEAEATIAEVLADYTVTVSHTRGSLTFTTDMDESTRGYFMMPDGDDTINWVVEGHDLAGNPVKKEGMIEHVQRAHEYTVNLHHGGVSDDPIGGALFSVTIDDRALVVEDVVTITGAPVITGVGFDLASGLSGEPAKWERRSIYVQAFGTLTSMKVHADNAAEMGLPASDFDFMNIDEAQRTRLAEAGIACEYATDEERCHARIFLEAAMLNRLPEGEYPLQLTAIDSNGKKRVRTVNIQVTDADVKLVETPWQEIYATSATLHGELTKENVNTPGFRYKVKGTPNWTEAVGTLDGNSYSAVISGLTPGTTYEYQAISTGHINSSTMTFTTESIFAIPNAGFEDWSQLTTNTKVLLPSGSGKVEWWDTGNHGSATMSKTVTENTTALKHSGLYSAMLKSQFVGIGSIGKFAAGNIFAGTYDNTDGTNGELTFGRPFNGSRPAKLAGYCYYKPGVVKWSETDELPTGQMDKGIIYVALTTKTYKILTKTKQLFDPEDTGVVAYGRIVFNEEYGSATEMRRFEITLTPGPAWSTARPTHLVLTASASQYGDYFTGGESVMYLDDLEFVY